MGGVWEHYGALWVVCGSIRERNYRLKKKNYLSGPTPRKHVHHVPVPILASMQCSHNQSISGQCTWRSSSRL